MTFKTFLTTTLSVAAMCVAANNALAAGDYLTLNMGEYEALRNDTQNRALQYGVEYRFSDVGYGFHPIVGGFGTSDGAAYGYAGINWEVAIFPNQLYLIPNFAVGAYKEGSGKRLGGALEFRSGIELDYQLPNQQRVGVALNHISNAGIYDHNSGEESILGTYSIPISTLKNLAGF